MKKWAWLLIPAVPIAGMMIALKNEHYRTQYLETAGGMSNSRVGKGAEGSTGGTEKAVFEAVADPADSGPPLVLKAKRGTGIYHAPGGRYYDQIRHDIEFASEQEASEAGYRKSQR